MINIAIYCVTYNSYNAAMNYLSSIDKILDESQPALTVFLADNTTNNPIDIKYKTEKFKLFVYKFNNIGYFGAIRKMMKTNDPKLFDYSIISNVDLYFKENIFKTLKEITLAKNIGWIAPQIFSLKEKRDLNPAIINRYSLFKLKILKFLYKHPSILQFYKNILYRNKNCHFVSCHSTYIYAGHGSFMILTKEFFKRCGIINYPVFLYDEELYLGEECKRKGLKVIYIPSMRVFDSENVSTSKLSSSFYCKCNIEGLTYIIKKYY